MSENNYVWVIEIVRKSDNSTVIVQVFNDLYGSKKYCELALGKYSGWECHNAANAYELHTKNRTAYIFRRRVRETKLEEVI